MPTANILQPGGNPQSAGGGFFRRRTFSVEADTRLRLRPFRGIIAIIIAISRYCRKRKGPGKNGYFYG